ncbi:FAD-binding oxidoreductase [Actinomadura livida]|nr:MULTISPECIES: FAD-binding oxidoreductase [Actinomadura]
MEVPSRLRHWRYYSMANAPRPDHTVDFHVRLVDGGPVSPVLVRGTETGDRVRMGAPVGTLTLDESSGRDVLLVAGSTGLAPLKAILEQISLRPDPPRVHLFFGARTRDGLYDLEDLTKLAGEFPWLTVVPAVSDESGGHGFTARLQSGGRAGGGDVEHGNLSDIVAGHGPWDGHDAYVCGPSAMVGHTVEQLARLGVPRDRIRLETFADAQR